MIKGFEIKLHAMREEIVEFANRTATDHNISVFSQSFGPFKSNLLKSSDFAKLSDNECPVTTLMFTVDDPKFQVKKQFPDEYTDSLFLPLPRIVDGKLSQIVFGFKVRKGDTYKEEAVRKWNLIHKELKSTTMNGLKTHFIKTGNMIFSNKSDRFTAGAKKFIQEGGVLSFGPGAQACLD